MITKFYAMFRLFLLLSLCYMSESCGSTKTSSNTNNTTQQSATTSANGNKNGAKDGEISRFLGTYTAKDQCNGDFDYQITIKRGVEANTLLLQGVGNIDPNVALPAQFEDVLQLSLGEISVDGVQIKGIGKALRDKATGIISLSYSMVDADGMANDCRASLIPK